MASCKNRIERLEKEQRFRTWVGFGRFLESLSDEQLEENRFWHLQYGDENHCTVSRTSQMSYNYGPL